MNTIEQKTELFNEVARVFPSSLESWTYKDDILGKWARIDRQGVVVFIEMGRNKTLCFSIYTVLDRFISKQLSTNMPPVYCCLPSFGLTKWFNKAKYEEIKKERELYYFVLGYLLNIIEACQKREIEAQFELEKGISELLKNMSPSIDEK